MGMQGTPIFIFYFSFFSNYDDCRHHDEGEITLFVTPYPFRCSEGGVSLLVVSILFLVSLCESSHLAVLFHTTGWGVYVLSILT